MRGPRDYALQMEGDDIGSRGDVVRVRSVYRHIRVEMWSEVRRDIWAKMPEPIYWQVTYRMYHEVKRRVTPRVANQVARQLEQDTS